MAGGYATGDQALLVRGVLLLLYGALIVAQVDNILKPLLIGGRANVHPVLILLGVLGGLATFGLIGFVVGPLVLALLKTFLHIYEQEREPGHAHG
jgi:predicted PurR-regulated permease PerM